MTSGTKLQKKANRTVSRITIELQFPLRESLSFFYEDINLHKIQNESWQVMPEAKGSAQGSFYRFESNLPSRKNVAEGELFAYMI